MAISLSDILSAMQNGVTAINRLNERLTTAFPTSTGAVSPVATGVNTLTTTVSVVLSSNAIRHSVIFHNPGTINIYLFPSNITTVPTLATVGGSFLMLPASTLSFPTLSFPNVTCGWSAFVSSGSSQPFTIVEFY